VPAKSIVGITTGANISWIDPSEWLAASGLTVIMFRNSLQLDFTFESDNANGFLIGAVNASAVYDDRSFTFADQFRDPVINAAGGARFGFASGRGAPRTASPPPDLLEPMIFMVAMGIFIVTAVVARCVLCLMGIKEEGGAIDIFYVPSPLP
jgi:hypothetical protein